MGIIGMFLSPIYSGMGTMMFYQKKYSGAVKYFEKAIKCNPKEKKIEYTYSHLGQCYLRLGRKRNALDALKKAYDLFHSIQNYKDDNYDREKFKNLLIAYLNILFELNEFEKVRDIQNELDSIVNRKY
ncbi:MAG: tetratricopeptide repeat protein [candidate division Zixibacteria bacterium]|nr:tetratricopeptide repeat protein [candidate division Zixibacteria bacterium]